MTAHAILGSEAWQGFLTSAAAQADLDSVLLPVAVLMPASLATTFEATLALIPRHGRRLTTVLIDFLAGLAALTPTDGTAS